MLRYGLERPAIIRIIDYLDGFRMIRFAFYIRNSREIDRRHVPGISEAIRGSGGIEYSYVSDKANESEYSPWTCSIGRPAGGTLCPRPMLLHNDVVGNLPL